MVLNFPVTVSFALELFRSIDQTRQPNRKDFSGQNC
jgi:hypothetical protein